MTSSTRPGSSHLPTFIGGFRSGTTLLINLLGMHPDITAWYETKCFCEALRWLLVLENPAREAFEADIMQPRAPAGFSAASVAARMQFHSRFTYDRMQGKAGQGKAAYESYPLGNDYILYSRETAEQALLAWQRTVSGQVTPQILARATGTLIKQLGRQQLERGQGRMWINKTPELPRFGRQLFQAMGPCRVINVIRDGRSVVASSVGLNWGSVERMSRLWKQMIQFSREAADSVDYLEIKYEELTASPVQTLAGIAEFLDLSLQPAQLLERYQAAGGIWKMDAAAELRNTLSDQDLAEFYRLAGDMHAELGYQR